MDSNLLKTKSIEQLVSDVEQGGRALRRSLTAWDLTLLGIGAIIGTGIFVLTGHGGSQSGRSSHHPFLHCRGHCVRVCRAVLRGIRRHDSDRRQRVYLRVRHAG